MTYHDEGPPSIASTMFDANPRNPAHKLLWQTGRLSRAALKKTVQMTRELPKYAAVQAPPDVRDATQRSVTYLKDASVRSAAFVQQTTVQARDRTVELYQKADVGPRTKAAVYYLGDQIKYGTATALHSVRVWGVRQ